MIRIKNLKLHMGEEKNMLLKRACKKLKCSEKDIKKWNIYKESLDARKKNDIFYIYTIDVEIKNEDKVLKGCKDKDVSRAEYYVYKMPEGEFDKNKRPVVVGFGPAGIFASLLLAQLGLKPVVFERGYDVDTRTEDIEKFFSGGELNERSNVQFGEGGAGTFSDGKLTTRIKNPVCGKIMSEFVKFGAPEEILYVHNPHIGTDKLKGVIKNIREEIIRLGGEVHFGCTVTDIFGENGKLCGLEINGSEKYNCTDAVFSIGHSARDTFELFYRKNIHLEAKPFAVGGRIEHKQKMINEAQYGNDEYAESLGAAEYKLTYTTKSGRGVYTFCMCPGGHVVAAASEKGMVAVNGMSYHAREGENANSALLVQINPEDYGTKTPLDGMYFQRELERKAFEEGGNNYNAPCQRVGDLLKGKESTALGDVKNTYRPNVKVGSVENVFPEFITEAMKEAIPQMGRRLKGFDSDDAIITAVESRSSSPVKIVRSLESGESISMEGLYPCGEGAGYAGGIMSAAVDGIYIAEKIAEKYRIK